MSSKTSKSTFLRPFHCTKLGAAGIVQAKMEQECEEFVAAKEDHLVVALWVRHGIDCHNYNVARYTFDFRDKLCCLCLYYHGPLMEDGYDR